MRIKIEDFLKYSFIRYIKENSDEDFKANYTIMLRDIIVFTTDYVYKQKEIDVMNNYHVGIIEDMFRGVVDTLYRNLSLRDMWGIEYSAILSQLEYLSNTRPSIMRDAKDNKDGKYYKIMNREDKDNNEYRNMSLELSDVVFVKIKEELEFIQANVPGADSFESIYDEVVKEGSYVLSFVFNKGFNLPAYFEKLGAVASDFITVFTDSTFVNYVVKSEIMKRALDRDGNPIVKVSDNPLVNSDRGGLRNRTSIEIFLSYCFMNVYDIVNKVDLASYKTLDLKQFLSTFKVLATSVNTETAAQYLLNIRMYDIVQNKMTDIFSTIISTYVDMMMFTNSSYSIIDKLNDLTFIKAEARFDLRQDKSNLKAVAYREALINLDYNSTLLLPMTQRFVINEALNELTNAREKLNKQPDKQLDNNENKVGNKVDETKEGIKEKMYEIKYKGKQFLIDKKKKRYEYLVNDITKDVHLIKSSTVEIMSVNEKQNLIAKAMYLRNELTSVRHKAEAVNDDDLVGLIDERISFLDDTIDGIHKRNIRQERKKVAFTIEKPLSDELRAMQNRNSYDSDDV